MTSGYISDDGVDHKLRKNRLLSSKGAQHVSDRLRKSFISLVQ